MWVLATFILANVGFLFLSQDVAPSQPVITVHRACGESKATPAADSANPCIAVVTREQFENLVQALHPGEALPTAARNNLAKLYAEYLAVEAAADESGMEDTAEYREFMNWMRALAASEYYRRKLQQKLSSPPREEIDAYYRQHLDEYESARLDRILIPREESATPNSKALAVADAARESLLKGVDAMEVQKQAWRELSLGDPQAVDVGTRKRKDLLSEEAAEVFSLRPGDITQIFTETKGYVIYKVVSRETASEESLAKNIARQLTEIKFREAMKSLLDGASADLNEKYFAAPGAAASGAPRSPHSIIVP